MNSIIYAGLSRKLQNRPLVQSSQKQTPFARLWRGVGVTKWQRRAHKSAASTHAVPCMWTCPLHLPFKKKADKLSIHSHAVVGSRHTHTNTPNIHAYNNKQRHYRISREKKTFHSFEIWFRNMCSNCSLPSVPRVSAFFLQPQNGNEICFNECLIFSLPYSVLE